MVPTIGRVIDSWRSDNDKGIIVDVAGEPVRIHSHEPIAHGALIELEANSPGDFRIIRVICEPLHWDPLGDVTRWRGERRKRLFDRQRVLHATRTWFDEQGFLEAETPLIAAGMAPDPHLDPFEVEGGYLVTSTEYQIKRLIVGGFTNVFTLTKNFRRGEIGALHNPEFTMLEWGRAGATLEHIASDAQRVIQLAFQAAKPGTNRLKWDAMDIDVMAPTWERVSLQDAFRRYLGMEIPASFDVGAIRDEFDRTRRAADVGVPANAFEAVSLLVDLIQPFLGTSVPTFLHGWPMFLTPSAECIPGSPSIADRVELFIGGIELADGFAFACDAARQKQRFAEAMRARKLLQTPPIGVDEKYIQALEGGLPPGAGMALGFDRLMMLLTGANHIRDVQTFAWDER